MLSVQFFFIPPQRLMQSRITNAFGRKQKATPAEMELPFGR
jgi:hypothetical protein